MTRQDLEQELARQDALRAAKLLAAGGGAAQDLRVATGVAILRGWSADADIRAVLRPVFQDAVPDQRALIALGDIDIWRREASTARAWWVQAAAGPHRELAALGAWRAARADLRARRVDDALPLLKQAVAAGIAGAALALGIVREERDDDTAAAALFRRSGTPEGMLRLAEIRLRAHDPAGAAEEIAHLAPQPRIPGKPDLAAWEHGVRGEIAFRRGELETAEDEFLEALEAPEGRGRLALLRLAQIAVAEGRACSAYARTVDLVGGTGAEADEARLLMGLHPDLMATGARLLDEDG